MCHLPPLNAHFHEIMAAKTLFCQPPFLGMLKCDSSWRRTEREREREGEGKKGRLSLWRTTPGRAPSKALLKKPECTAVAAMRLRMRMRMRILTRPRNSLANFRHQISNKKLRIRRCEGIRWRMRMVLRMKWLNFVLSAEIPYEWTLATKFASDCDCNGVVHSGQNREAAQNNALRRVLSEVVGVL